MTQEERSLFTELVNTLFVTDKQLQCEVKSIEDWRAVFRENARLLDRATALLIKDVSLQTNILYD